MSVGGRDRDRAMVIKKTGGPVQFEITEQTHNAIGEWLAALSAGRDQYLFEPIPGTAADLDTPVRAHRQGDFGLCRGTDGDRGDRDRINRGRHPGASPAPRGRQNFQDHYIARMSCEVQGIETLNERGRGLFFCGRAVALCRERDGHAGLQRLAVRRLGQGAGGIRDPGCAVCFRPGELQAGADPGARRQARHHRRPWQMQPLSRGYVSVRSPDPREQPAINPRYLAEDADRRAMVGGLKFLRRLFAAPSLAKYVVAETMRDRVCRPTTSCWTMRGRTARPSITRAAAA